MRAQRTLSTAALAVLLGGCIIDTVPLPDETSDHLGDDDQYRDGDGPPSEGQAGVNTSALFYTSGTPSLLVGAVSAVPPLLRVRVANPSRPSWTGETTSAADGSFYLPIAAAAGEQLEIDVLAADDGVVASATLQLEPPSSEASRAYMDTGFDGDGTGNGDPSAAPLVIDVSSPDAGGMASVSGGAGVLSPSIVVVVGNVDRGNAVSTAVQADGSFIVPIAAQSGDELAILLAEAAVSNASAGTITAYVP